jgi:hypothetical protein
MVPQPVAGGGASNTIFMPLLVVVLVLGVWLIASMWRF